MKLLPVSRPVGYRELAALITAWVAVVMLGLWAAPSALAAEEPAASDPAASERAPDKPAPNEPAADDSERLRVADPYLELHTGPGRGFPVFFVVPRDGWVVVQLRSTDWYKVRTEGGKEGWVHRSQLVNTFTVAGGQKTFRDIALDDYLARRLQLGAAWGRFKNDPMLKLWASYRLSDTLGIEGTVAQVQGTFSGSDIWHVNLTAEPLSDQRLSPYFAIGVGRFKNLPNQTLVGALPNDAKLSNASVGVRYHLTDRFIVRADYTLYTAFVGDTRTGEFRAKTIGLAFFF